MLSEYSPPEVEVEQGSGTGKGTGNVASRIARNIARNIAHNPAPASPSCRRLRRRRLLIPTNTDHYAPTRPKRNSPDLDRAATKKIKSKSAVREGTWLPAWVAPFGAVLIGFNPNSKNKIKPAGGRTGNLHDPRTGFHWNHESADGLCAAVSWD